jgi:predicted permease
MSTTRELRSRAVTRIFLCAVAIAAAIAFGPGGANAQSTLNQNQGALYLACIGAASVGNLPVNLNPNLYAAAILTNQQVVSQSQSITSLQGLTFVQLGESINTNIKRYASKELNCTHKCTNQVLTAFMTQNQASCLAIAQGYAP